MKSYPARAVPKLAGLAADSLRAASPLRPHVAIILGSGLGGLAATVSDATVVPFGRIPGFFPPSVAGHPGSVSIGFLGGVAVYVLAGRAHLYEGYAAHEVAFPVWVLAKLGVKILIATNAAGGIAADLAPGDVMVLSDHVNLPGLAGHNPLAGYPDPDARFIPLADCYDATLQDLASRELLRAGLRSRSGVYAMVAGPTYESPAEIRSLRAFGADAVGMSTVPEVIVARQQGMRMLAMSLITNSHAASSHTSHDEVLAVARESAVKLERAAVAIVAAAGGERS